MPMKEVKNNACVIIRAQKRERQAGLVELKQRHVKKSKTENGHVARRPFILSFGRFAGGESHEAGKKSRSSFAALAPKKAHRRQKLDAITGERIWMLPETPRQTHTKTHTHTSHFALRNAACWQAHKAPAVKQATLLLARKEGVQEVVPGTNQDARRYHPLRLLND